MGSIFRNESFANVSADKKGTQHDSEMLCCVEKLVKSKKTKIV